RRRQGSAGDEGGRGREPRDRHRRSGAGPRRSAAADGAAPGAPAARRGGGRPSRRDPVTGRRRPRRRRRRDRSRRTGDLGIDKEARVPSKSANVKNEKQYEKLKEKGMSKERAAKIAN